MISLLSNIKQKKKMTFENKKQKFENTAIGFSNIGNTCYMNSFLQILLHCPNFLNELKVFDKKYNSQDFGKDLINEIINECKRILNISYEYE